MVRTAAWPISRVEGDDLMTEPMEFGKFYWCVTVPSAIARAGQIYLYADRVEVTPAGDVLFWRAPGIGEQQDHLNLSLARGCWYTVFAASMLNNQAVAVQQWEGGEAGG